MTARDGSYIENARRKHREWAPWITIAALIVLTGALAAAWYYTPLSELITGERLNRWAKAARATWWAPLVLIVAYTPSMFLMVPRPALTLIAVVAFGAWLGLAYAMAGIILSSVVAYYLGRAMSPALVERLAGDTMQNVKDVLRRHGVLAMFTLRVLPAAPFVLESMACGLLRVKLWHYVIGTALGMAPGVLAMTVFGHQVAAALSDTAKVNYWIIGGVIVVFIVSMYFVRRLLSQRNSTQ